MKVSIIVPVRNRPDMVSRLIKCFNSSEAKDIEQVYIDDASDQETKDLLLKHVASKSNASYLRNDRQQLFTRTLNRGIRSAQPDTEFYCCVNTDCILKPGWLQRLIDAHVEHHNAAIIGYADGRPAAGEGEHQAFCPTRAPSPDYITGHCFTVPKWAFNTVGLFCETDLSQAHISSERLWCWRACGDPPYGKGFEMFYVNSDLCIHDEGGASWHRDLGWLFSFDHSTLWDGKDNW